MATGSQSQPGLYVVGPIQTVQAIRPKHSLLLADQSGHLRIDAVVAKSIHHIPQPLNQLLTVLELIVLALLMEVVELVAQVVHPLALLTHHLLKEITQLRLLLLLFTQQVYRQHSRVYLSQLREVKSEGVAREC